MRVQDYIVDTARKAAEMAFLYAEKVPADKLDWNPLDTGQSVIRMCRELAVTPIWAIMGLGGNIEGWSEDQAAAMHQEMADWATVAQCKAEFEKNFPKWEAVARAMPDEKLPQKKWLEVTKREHTYLELLDYVQWNSTYHLGQIAYIQTLYGDKETYF